MSARPGTTIRTGPRDARRAGQVGAHGGSCPAVEDGSERTRRVAVGLILPIAFLGLTASLSRATIVVFVRRICLFKRGSSREWTGVRALRVRLATKTGGTTSEGSLAPPVASQWRSPTEHGRPRSASGSLRRRLAPGDLLFASGVDFDVRLHAHAPLAPLRRRRPQSVMLPFSFGDATAEPTLDLCWAVGSHGRPFSAGAERCSDNEAFKAAAPTTSRPVMYNQNKIVPTMPRIP